MIRNRLNEPLMDSKYQYYNIEDDEVRCESKA